MFMLASLIIIQLTSCNEPVIYINDVPYWLHRRCVKSHTVKVTVERERLGRDWKMHKVKEVTDVVVCDSMTTDTIQLKAKRQ